LEEKIQFEIRKKGSVILIVFYLGRRGRRGEIWCEPQSTGGFKKKQFWNSIRSGKETVLEKAREEKTREDFMDTVVRFWKICNTTETSKVKEKEVKKGKHDGKRSNYRLMVITKKNLLFRSFWKKEVAKFTE
jgi:hypothetical protein